MARDGPVATPEHRRAFRWRRIFVSDNPEAEGGEAPSVPWAVYLLDCGRGRSYIGISPTPEQRFEAHVAGTGRLVELMPYYSHRFTVKPGIFSWARLHLPRDPIPAETDRISYDLYYVKEGSPALDLEILIRSLFRFGKAVRTPAQG